MQIIFPNPVPMNAFINIFMDESYLVETELKDKSTSLLSVWRGKGVWAKGEGGRRGRPDDSAWPPQKKWSEVSMEANEVWQDE